MESHSQDTLGNQYELSFDFLVTKQRKSDDLTVESGLDILNKTWADIINFLPNSASAHLLQQKVKDVDPDNRRGSKVLKDSVQRPQLAVQTPKHSTLTAVSEPAKIELLQKLKKTYSLHNQDAGKRTVGENCANVSISNICQLPQIEKVHNSQRQGISIRSSDRYPVKEHDKNLHSHVNVNRLPVCSPAHTSKRKRKHTSPLIVNNKHGLHNKLVQQGIPQNFQVQQRHNEQVPHWNPVTDSGAGSSIYDQGNIPQSDCPEVSGKSQCGSSIISPNGFILSCEVCEERFDSMQELKQHLSVHTDVWTVKCSICCKRFTHQSILNSHLKSHGVEEPYECGVCHKTFRYKNTLQRHFRNVHKEGKRRCKECNKCYDIGDYDSHAKFYHGNASQRAKPYQCDVCNSCFATAASLRSHKFVHSEERTCLCTVCGKAFKKNASLQAHVKSHSVKVSCKICQKKYPPTSIKQHMMLHGAQRKFSCEKCGMKFIMKHHLKTHMKSHLDERPYVCDICEKSFKLPHRLREHRKIHGKRVD